MDWTDWPAPESFEAGKVLDSADFVCNFTCNYPPSLTPLDYPCDLDFRKCVFIVGHRNHKHCHERP